MSAEEKLNELAELHAASTQGTWIAYDLADYPFASTDPIRCWWVWREEDLPNYGGVVQLNHAPSPGDPPGQPIGSTEFAGGISTRRQDAEEMDAKFIAAAHNHMPKLINTLGAILTLHKRVEYPDPDHSSAMKNICVECDDNWPCWTYKVATTAWEK